MAVLLVSVLAGLALMAAQVSAQTPPTPTFFWPYGRVQVGGANLSPAMQPVIAFVNGKACGEGSTLVAVAGEGTPSGDIGKTVYVIDVLANGTAPGERVGCGNAGDAVTLYFPLSGIALQVPAFQQGGRRVDLDIGTVTTHRLAAPLVARDGTQ